jgi:hypothetical protein
LKQVVDVVDEACNNAKNYKMTTMPPLKLAKLIKKRKEKGSSP